MGNTSTLLQSGNTYRIAKATYRAQVAQTTNNNKLEAAKVGFSDFMRTLSNKARVNAASKEYNFQMEQLSEELRASTNAGFNTQVNLAAARGALTAQAGMVGVGGSSADLMDSMVRLQSEMDLESQMNARNLLASRGARQTAQIMANAYKGMDLSRTFGNFDFTQHIAPQPLKHKFAKLVGVAVATYFGGPMAGEAVAGAFVGDWQARNGDFQGASKTFGNAIQGGLSAFRDWGERGGQSWGSAVAQGNRWQQKGRVTDWGEFGPGSSSWQFSNINTSSDLGWFGGQ